MCLSPVFVISRWCACYQLARSLRVKRCHRSRISMPSHVARRRASGGAPPSLSLPLCAWRGCTSWGEKPPRRRSTVRQSWDESKKCIGAFWVELETRRQHPEARRQEPRGSLCCTRMTASLDAIVRVVVVWQALEDDLAVAGLRQRKPTQEKSAVLQNTLHSASQRRQVKGGRFDTLCPRV